MAKPYRCLSPKIRTMGPKDLATNNGGKTYKSSQTFLKTTMKTQPYSRYEPSSEFQIPIFILLTVFLISIASYIAVQVIVIDKTLHHLHKNNMLDEEWSAYAEFLQFSPKPKGQKKSLFSKKGVLEVVDNVFIETSMIRNKIISKTAPKAKEEPKTATQQMLHAVGTSLAPRDPNLPSMYIRKGFKDEPNPLDKLPRAVALPFRIADKTWDVATDVAAGSIQLCVISPIRFSRQLLATIVPQKKVKSG